MSELIFIVCSTTKEWSGYINGKFWTIQKLANKVKMYDENYEFHYRFNSKDMAEIRKQLAAQIEKHDLHKGD